MVSIYVDYKVRCSPLKKFIYLNFFEYWLKIKLLECNTSTIYAYCNIINNHILPYYTSKEIRSISSIYIEEYLENLLQKKYRGSNLNKATSLKHYGLLCHAFKKMKKAKQNQDNYRAPSKTIIMYKKLQI